MVVNMVRVRRRAEDDGRRPPSWLRLGVDRIESRGPRFVKTVGGVHGRSTRRSVTEAHALLSLAVPCRAAMTAVWRNNAQVMPQI